MTAIGIDRVVFFDGQQTAGAWGAAIRAFAPCSANGTPLEPCGTFAAYQRHMRRDEGACPPCAAVPGRMREARRAAA